MEDFRREEVQRYRDEIELALRGSPDNYSETDEFFTKLNIYFKKMQQKISGKVV